MSVESSFLEKVIEVGEEFQEVYQNIDKKLQIEKIKYYLLVYEQKVSQI